MGIGKEVIFGSLFLTSKPHTLRNFAAMRSVFRASLIRIAVTTATTARWSERFSTASEVRRKSRALGAGRVATRVFYEVEPEAQSRWKSAPLF